MWSIALWIIFQVFEPITWGVWVQLPQFALMPKNTLKQVELNPQMTFTLKQDFI